MCKTDLKVFAHTDFICSSNKTVDNLKKQNNYIIQICMREAMKF